MCSPCGVHLHMPERFVAPGSLCARPALRRVMDSRHRGPTSRRSLRCVYPSCRSSGLPLRMLLRFRWRLLSLSDRRCTRIHRSSSVCFRSDFPCGSPDFPSLRLCFRSVARPKSVRTRQSAVAQGPFPGQAPKRLWGGGSYRRLPFRRSVFSFPKTWCGDALRVLLKPLHGRIAHAASSFTRGTPDIQTTFVFCLPAGIDFRRFRLHPTLFRCHPRDALRTSTLA